MICQLEIRATSRQDCLRILVTVGIQSFKISQSAASQFLMASKNRKVDTRGTERDEADVLAAEIVLLTMNAGPSPTKSSFH